MSDKLQVEIGAEIKELQSKLKDAQSRLKKFSNNADKDLSKLNKNSTIAAKGVGKLGKGAANAVPAMNEFSRVIQDAPFGIQGIANNITQLTQNFGYLKAKTGSTSSALKAMTATLTGPAGILLAISAITSLMVAYGDKLNFTKDKVKDLKREQEELTKSLENHALQLNAVSRARLQGTQSAQKELLNLRLLKQVAEDNTIATSKRKAAIKKLRDLYPDYLKNLSDEKVLNGGLTTIYNKLTTSILKRAKATAAMNQIVKNEEQLINLRSQVLQVSENLKKEEDEIRKRRVLNPATGVAQKIEDIKNAGIRAENQLKKLRGQIQNLELTNIDLEQDIELTSGLKIKPEPNKPVFVEELKANLKDINKEILDVIDIDAINTDLEFNTVDWDEYLNLKGLERAQQKLIAFNAGAKNIIEGGISNTFSLLGESIGNGALSAEQALTRGLGGLLSSMGDYLIKAGTAAVLAGTLAKLFGTISGVGAGLAAIAGGVALKGIGSSISDFQGAGNSTGSTNAGTTSSSGGSSFRGGSSVNTGLQNVVFEIQGTKLVGVLSNTLKRNKNQGGNLGLR